MKRYEVWLTVEEWDGDSKISDVETFLVGSHKNLNKAVHLWATLESLAVSIKQSLYRYFRATFGD
jgi:hypothetical protein